MKTPMQELLEWVRATLPMDLDTPRMIEQKIESMLEKERDDWPRKSHKDFILPFSVYDLHLRFKCIGFALCLYPPYNNFIMSCNCNKPMSIIELCLRDRDENGIEND